ncbi:hypothetical protein [Dankookia sp. P2]|uniref:hypothetical protein n=1 Tax=Dankookia sp. P2 TaxID=3423955 RepID=UPI003D6667C2
MAQTITAKPTTPSARLSKPTPLVQTSRHREGQREEQHQGQVVRVAQHRAIGPADGDARALDQADPLQRVADGDGGGGDAGQGEAGGGHAEALRGGGQPGDGEDHDEDLDEGVGPVGDRLVAPGREDHRHRRVGEEPAQPFQLRPPVGLDAAEEEMQRQHRDGAERQQLRDLEGLEEGIGLVDPEEAEDDEAEAERERVAHRDDGDDRREAEPGDHEGILHRPPEPGDGQRHRQREDDLADRVGNGL